MGAVRPQCDGETGFLHFGVDFRKNLKDNESAKESGFMLCGGRFTIQTGDMPVRPERKHLMKSNLQIPGAIRTLLAGILLMGLIVTLSSRPARASDLGAFQSSVISTDLFLTWIPAQEKDLKLSSGQIAALREVQGDFRGKSQEVGRRIERNAKLLSEEVGKYPINLAKIKPAIGEISTLRGELTYHAIKSLYRVQTILSQAQWDQAKAEWAHVLAAQAVESSKGQAPPPKKSK